MKTFTIAMLFLTGIAASAVATAQWPDRIVYEGKEYSLHSNPMTDYFARHPDKIPKTEVMSTALWRGYVATFGFDTNNTLVLKDIVVQTYEEKNGDEDPYDWKSVITSIVPKGQTLKIDWFTGILVLPHGELVNYVHMGYGSTYSKYTLLEIKKGKLTGKRSYDFKAYEVFKERQFQAYKKTEAYKQRLAAIKEEGDSQEQLDAFLRSFVVTYTSEFLDDPASPVGQASRPPDNPTTGEAEKQTPNVKH